jgi:pimeloyl-ACP methyl ester carboxylesterase
VTSSATSEITFIRRDPDATVCEQGCPIMKYQRAVLPPRTDLRSRRTRLAARVMVRGLDHCERLKSLLLVEVPHPADDPFARVAEDVDAFSPGEVIDARPVEVRWFRRQINTDAWQLKFRSTDSSGAAVSGITTVMIPRRPFNGSVRPLLSYQCAIDSLGATADPSYTLRHGDQLELPLMLLALRRGWAVVTTDHTGPQHAFGALPLAARFVLDGIRAAVAFGPAGFDAATPIGLCGYSGGAQATLWAAEQHPGYAPELNLVAAAGGGAGVDLTSSPRMFEAGNLLSGIPFGAVIGLSREFPDVDLLGVLTPEGQALVAAAAEMTIEQLVVGFPFLRWSDHLTVSGVLEIPGMRNALEATRLGQATPMTSMYVYHAVHDRYPAIADVDRLVENYRREGVDVTYRRFRFGGHLTVALTGAPSTVRFLSERLDRPSSDARG